jgi:hypothetical protein
MQYSITETSPGKFEITDDYSIYWHEGTRASAKAYIDDIIRQNQAIDAITPMLEHLNTARCITPAECADYTARLQELVAA